MSLAESDPDAPEPSPRSGLAAARARLAAPTAEHRSLWPVVGAAFVAACAGLAAAAAVILGAPSFGAPSKAVLPPVSHVVGF